MAPLKALLILQALAALASAQSTTIIVSNGVSTTAVLPAWPSESYSSTTTTTETSVLLSGMTTTTTTMFVPLSIYPLVLEVELTNNSSPTESSTTAAESTLSTLTPGGPVANTTSTTLATSTSTVAEISSYLSSVLSVEHSNTATATDTATAASTESPTSTSTVSLTSTTLIGITTATFYPSGTGAYNVSATSSGLPAYTGAAVRNAREGVSAGALVVAVVGAIVFL